MGREAGLTGKGKWRVRREHPAFWGVPVLSDLGWSWGYNLVYWGNLGRTPRAYVVYPLYMQSQTDYISYPKFSDLKHPQRLWVFWALGLGDESTLWQKSACSAPASSFHPPYGIIWWAANHQPIPVLETGNASLVPIQSTNKFTGTRAPDLCNKLTRFLRSNGEKSSHNTPF